MKDAELKELIERVESLTVRVNEIMRHLHFPEYMMIPEYDLKPEYHHRMPDGKLVKVKP